MFETTVNVTDDEICTLIVTDKQDSFDIDIFNGKKRT